MSMIKQWASARISAAAGRDPESPTNPDVLDQLIVWRMNDPRFTDRSNQVKGLKMQRQWTIEARADFADKDKNEVITRLIREAAVHVHANLALLMDNGQAPQVVAFSDDFFDGHQELKLHEDKLGQAIEAHGDTMSSGGVSQELLDAAAEMQHDKNNGA